MTDGPLRILPHLDDVGATHGSVVAWRALRRAGVVRSASVMVPCPWYRAAVDDWKDEPDQDLGIHVTLTSEWPHYRWRPLIGPTRALCDDDGFLHRRPEAVARFADPAAVEAEMVAQIERAIADGIRPTHLDAHMGTVFLPPFVHSLLTVAERFDLPVAFARDFADLFGAVRVASPDAGLLAEVVAELEGRGQPVFDRFVMGFAPEGTAAGAFFAPIYAALAPGLYWHALHANAPGDMAAIAPHMQWPREEEFRFFSDPASMSLFEGAGARAVNWLDLAVNSPAESA